MTQQLNRNSRAFGGHHLMHGGPMGDSESAALLAHGLAGRSFSRRGATVRWRWSHHLLPISLCQEHHRMDDARREIT